MPSLYGCKTPILIGKIHKNRQDHVTYLHPVASTAASLVKTHNREVARRRTHPVPQIVHPLSLFNRVHGRKEVRGGCQNDAIRVVLLDHLQKAVQNSSDLTNLVALPPVRAYGIKFVKKVHAPGFGNGIEKDAQLRSRFKVEFLIHHSNGA
ncbi:MAG: hypothetical protein WBV95_06375 [Desulfobacterales bacterium]